MRAEYAAGFKLDDWGQLHELDRSDTDSAYQQVGGIRERYRRYQGQVEGQPPGPPSTIRLPHIKGSTPDKDTTPTESELAGSDHRGSDLEESREALEEGEVQEDYTGIRSRETDTESEDTTPSTPRPCRQGKRRADWMEESPRSREGREAAETLEQEMGRHSVAEARSDARLLIFCRWPCHPSDGSRSV